MTFHGYEPGQSYHSVGDRVGAWQWQATKASGPGFLTYGRYSRGFLDGAFKATYTLSVDDNSTDDAVIAYIDVFDKLNSREIVRREIHRKEFNAPQSAQPFDLSFATLGRTKLEFRIFVFGNARIVHWATTIATEALLTGDAIFNATPKLIAKQLTGVATSSSNNQASEGAVNVFYTVFSAPTPGNYSARFGLLIDANPRNDLKVATLEVRNRSSDNVLATVDLKSGRFSTASRTQIFEVPFAYDGVGEVELRVYILGNAVVRPISTAVYRVSQLRYQGADAALSHQMGHAKGNAWVNDPGNGPGYLTYGPYTASVPPGITTATFNLAIDDNRSNNNIVAQIDAHDASTDRILARRVIKRMDFAAPSAQQEFDLVFELADVTSLEWRVFAFQSAELQHNSTIVRPDRLTMTALWNQRAHFEYRKRDVFNSNGSKDSATSSLNALDGIWYAFNREPASNLNPEQASKCERVGRGGLKVVVRKSSDRGATWSDPTEIVVPSESESAPDFCEIVDGSAYFDSESDTWHYLGQCLNQASYWNLCHYTREGSSPLGHFTSDSANPVVRGGQLWSEICGRDPRLCPTDMRDEGTPEIISKDSDGYFYVTFHGAEYAAINKGARGVARTLDFVNWQTKAPGLPGTPMLSIADCQRWNVSWDSDTCIGEGAAKILRSDNYYYMLAEAADMTLACKGGQTWIFGLYRNSILGASGTWQSYPSNPFITNKNVSPEGCALQYMNLIRDRGELFLEFSLYTPSFYFPNYIYQLVDGSPKSAVMHVE